MRTENPTTWNIFQFSMHLINMFTSSPLGLKAMAVTSAKMSIVSCSADDSIQFQILIDPSHEPVIKVVEAKVGENCNEVTGPSCPLSTSSKRPNFIDHKYTSKTS